MAKRKRKKTEIPDFLISESGVSAVEYALLAASVLIIVAGLLSSDVLLYLDSTLISPEDAAHSIQSASEQPRESL